jgi:BirA family biotin operon repressor/biotin-[acetyl-CoA-carboxylase] ligase
MDAEKPVGIKRTRLLERLGTSLFSTRLMALEEVDSTQLWVKRLAQEGAPEGTLVLAELQTAGRGRVDRRWVSPAGANLTFSLLLRPDLPVERVFVITMILALSALDGIRQRTGLKAMIKWPNDLYLDGKKMAGILTEFSVTRGSLDYVIPGIGINVNWCPETGPDLLYPATSLRREAGREIDREDLLASVLLNFETYYLKTLHQDTEVLYRKWNEQSMVIGREVRVISGSETMEGKGLRIDRSGALIIQVPSGEEKKVLCGDVSLRLVESIREGTGPGP